MQTSHPCRVGHDHLVSLGVAPEIIAEWIATGRLTPSGWDGFCECSPPLEWRHITRSRLIGRAHLVALGVGEKQIDRWRRLGVLLPTRARGFYAISAILFDWVRRTPGATPPQCDVEEPEAPPEPDTPQPPPATNVEGLHIVACTVTQARAFVAQHHRHLGSPVSGLFAVGVAQGPDLVGVAIVGRPVARGLQDGAIAEVTRLCTLGARNACSMLLGACRRGSIALGYRRLVTYTLTSEPGTSLRAAGWHEVAAVRGRTWNCPSRPRSVTAGADKRGWEARLPSAASSLSNATRVAV